MNIKIFIYILLLNLMLINISSAKSIVLTDKKLAIIQQIENYLHSVNSYYGKIIQLEDGQKPISAELYLSKPGKLRLEYYKPLSIIIIARNNVVTYYNKELEQEKYINLNNHAISYILTSPRISLIKDTKIYKVEEKKNSYSIILQTKKDKTGNKYEFIFRKSKKPGKIILGKIRIYQTNGNKITMHISDYKINKRINDGKFVIQSKKLFRDRD